MIVLLRRLGANRTGNYSYNTLKERNVRGDSPPCGFTPAQVIILITPKRKKLSGATRPRVGGDSPLRIYSYNTLKERNIRGDSPPHPLRIYFFIPKRKKCQGRLAPVWLHTGFVLE